MMEWKQSFSMDLNDSVGNSLKFIDDKRLEENWLQWLKCNDNNQDEDERNQCINSPVPIRVWTKTEDVSNDNEKSLSTTDSHIETLQKESVNKQYEESL